LLAGLFKNYYYLIQNYCFN